MHTAAIPAPLHIHADEELSSNGMYYTTQARAKPSLHQSLCKTHYMPKEIKLHFVAQSFFFPPSFYNHEIHTDPFG